MMKGIWHHAKEDALVCLAKSVLGTDYAQVLERITLEFAMESQNLADRADAQEGVVPHM